MAYRVPDVLELRGAPGVWKSFEELTISSSLSAPSEAQMVIGDVGNWKDLEAVVRPGEEYGLAMNGRTILQGRVEAQESPGGPGSGVRIVLTLHTKASDARYASADPTIKVQGVTIKAFVLALFEQHGFSEADFYFAPGTAVDLLTGLSKGSTKKSDLDAIQLTQAKVQLPESVWECATRHLARHGMSIWDGPDGKLCVGAPDDTAKPTYTIRCRRDGPGSTANNVGTFKRIRDWRDVASDVAVFGATDGKETSRAPIRGATSDVDVLGIAADKGHFFRPIRLPAERAKTAAEAQRMATRELSARRRRKDAWEITSDGWGYWDGERVVPWSINAVANVEVDAAGGPAGPYLIWRVAYKLANGQGANVQMAVVAPGIWDLGGSS